MSTRRLTGFGMIMGEVLSKVRRLPGGDGAGEKARGGGREGGLQVRSRQWLRLALAGEGNYTC